MYLFFVFFFLIYSLLFYLSPRQMGTAQDFGAVKDTNWEMCFPDDGSLATLDRTDESIGSGQGRDCKNIVKLFN